MKLIYERSRMPVCVGDNLTLDDGEAVMVSTIVKPHKPNSTGRVCVRNIHNGEESCYFPGVVKAVWIDREDQ
jgi:hypothetical protein